MNAEQAYLFRHALLRDAAYELQLPATRAALHELVLEVLEAQFGGTPPEKPDKGIWHAADQWATELVLHARIANKHRPSPRLALAMRTYVRRAALQSERSYRLRDALLFWREHAALVDPPERLQSLRNAAVCALDAGLVSEARTATAALIECAQATENAAALGDALQMRGNFHLYSSEPELAIESYSSALEHLRSAGAERSAAIVHSNRAIALHQLERHVEAEHEYHTALALHRRLGNRRVEGNTLGNLARLLHALGDREGSLRMTLEALAIHRETGNRRFEGIALGNLGVDEARYGNNEHAGELLRQALAIHLEVSNLTFVAEVSNSLATWHLRRSEFAEAEQYLKQSIEVSSETGNQRAYALSLSNRAELYSATGEIAAADELFPKALELCIRQGGVLSGLYVECSAAVHSIRARRIDIARQQWADAGARIKLHGEPPDFSTVRDEMRRACLAAGIVPFE
ncbi:MAG: tetratricopeptide repeat protein [Planctomycetes bacterium]|nr:tetratricopeptide repeat protein [Planctomycetota bacterium]MCW8136891.1 tetratricopeptide repeat protein [Planctomycetota bacterium]